MNIVKETFKKYTTYRLLLENGVKVGKIYVEKEEKFSDIPTYKGKKTLYIYNFGIYNGFRGEGYGKKLLAEILKRYKGKYDVIHLDACPTYGAPNILSMKQLINFYTSFGFKIYKKKEEYTVMVLTKNGTKN